MSVLPDGVDTPMTAIEGDVRPAIVIPTYNHAAKVVDVVARAAVLGLPVIVVNDGSRDGTSAALNRWIDERPEVRAMMVEHPRNMGKAAALATGFREARRLGATHAVTIDADGQLDPEDIPKLVEESRRNHEALILGRRPDRMEGCPPRCRVGRRSASLAVLAQTGLRLGDTQCGLRVYPLELIENVRCRSGGYAFEGEIITRAAWAGFAVREVDVQCRYFPAGERVSHWRPWRDSLRQAGVHMRLLGAALVPWRTVPARRGAGAESRWRRLVGWINPARAFREIRDEGIGDLELAWGLALGAMIGTLPFYGFHTLMSAYAAWRLHLHPATVILGSQVSTPPLGIFVIIASVMTGHFALNGALPEMDLEALRNSLATWSGASAWLGAWMVGSLIVGAVLGAGAYLVGLGLARIIRAQREASSRRPDTRASR